MLFTPLDLRQLRLKNRFIKTAAFEGMSPGGQVSPALIAHHRELAEKEVALTTLAYCAVEPGGRTFPDQLAMEARSYAGMAQLAEAVHQAGGAVSVQLGHCGRFSRNRAAGLPRGPSWAFNPYGVLSGLPWARALTTTQIATLVEAFARAAKQARELGFDAVEIHLGHGYLLSQFLSPLANRRRDDYGGSLENRMRLPLEVLAAVRAAVGPDFPVLAKINLRDGVRGGWDLADTLALVPRLEAAGVDALVTSGGFIPRSAYYLMRGHRPLWAMIKAERNWATKAALFLFGPLLVKPYPFVPHYFLDDARRVRAATRLPLVLLGGISNGASLQQAMAAGFDAVAMGRALIADPDLVQRVRADAGFASRCNQCNLCVARMEEGVRCHL